MRTFPAIIIAGIGAVALAGTGVAAARKEHVMKVALPDGSTARIEYAGDVPPKISVEPATGAVLDSQSSLPAFAPLDRMMEALDRQAEAMFGQMDVVGSQPRSASASSHLAAVGDLPSQSDTTIVSYSNGTATCTRTTQTISQGPGKPPKVSSSLSGDCEGQSAPPRSSSSPIINHT